MEQPITLMSQILPDFLNKFFLWLGTPIWENGFAHWGWLFIHFSFVFLLYYLLKFKFKEKRPVLFTFIFISLFEVFEYLISWIIPIILRETILDSAFDLCVGGLAILTGFLIFRNKKV